MKEFILIVLCLSALKSFFIGSDFSFYLWYKYGKNYIKWYGSRQEFPKDKYPLR